MILQWRSMGLDIKFQENETKILAIENQELYSSFISELIYSLENSDGLFSLYEGEKKININKSVEIIFSPILLDLNSKKIQTYLFAEMRAISDESGYGIKEEANVAIIRYLDYLSQHISYPIKFKLELDENSLYKNYEVRMDFEDGTLLEKMMNYIHILGMLCNTKLLVCVGIKSYFSEKQQLEIYKCAFQNKVHLLLIEGSQSSCLSTEKYCIIDKDKCFIQCE